MPIQRTSAASPAVVREAIASASQQTGASFEYLLTTAQRESGMRTNAKSPTSSAAGLFQFVESTWLKMVKDEGPRLGLSEQASQIRQDSDGQYHVASPKARRAILALRHDAETAALVAGAFTERNADYVASRIGRQPTEGELYLAHFFGPGSAAKMIQLVEAHPDQSAASYFPNAARANRSIFYDNGRPRSLSDVYQSLISAHLDEGSGGSSTLHTRYGPLDFGTMGSLIGDIERNRGKATDSLNGSIGVWGNSGGVTGSDATPMASSKARAADDTGPETTASVDTHTTAPADVGEPSAALHSFAASHYRAANAAAPSASSTVSHDETWVRQAFGG